MSPTKNTSQRRKRCVELRLGDIEPKFTYDLLTHWQWTTDRYTSRWKPCALGRCWCCCHRRHIPCPMLLAHWASAGISMSIFAWRIAVSVALSYIWWLHRADTKHRSMHWDRWIHSTVFGAMIATHTCVRRIWMCRRPSGTVIPFLLCCFPLFRMRFYVPTVFQYNFVALLSFSFSSSLSFGLGWICSFRMKSDSNVDFLTFFFFMDMDIGHRQTFKYLTKNNKKCDVLKKNVWLIRTAIVCVHKVNDWILVAKITPAKRCTVEAESPESNTTVNWHTRNCVAFFSRSTRGEKSPTTDWLSCRATFGVMCCVRAYSCLAQTPHNWNQHHCAHTAAVFFFVEMKTHVRLDVSMLCVMHTIFQVLPTWIKTDWRAIQFDSISRFFSPWLIVSKSCA